MTVSMSASATVSVTVTVSEGRMGVDEVGVAEDGRHVACGDEAGSDRQREDGDHG